MPIGVGGHDGWRGGGIDGSMDEYICKEQDMYRV